MVEFRFHPLSTGTDESPQAPGGAFSALVGAAAAASGSVQHDHESPQLYTQHREMADASNQLQPRVDSNSAALSDEALSVHLSDLNDVRALESQLTAEISRGVDIFNEQCQVVSTLQSIAAENDRFLVLLERYSTGLPDPVPPALPTQITTQQREIHNAVLAELLQQ